MNRNKLKLATGWGLAVFLAATTAWAQSANVTGKVHTVDIVNRSVTLADGRYYLFPLEIKLEDLKEGDQVTIVVDSDAKINNWAKEIAKSGQQK